MTADAQDLGADKAADARLEAGWPAHWATYTGRPYEAILADLQPVELRLLKDEPLEGDDALYPLLWDELQRHPAQIDSEACAVAEYFTFYKAVPCARLRAAGYHG